jgi:hypothetical protein
MFAHITAQQPRTAVAKGGDDRNGAYEAVANWWKPAPEHDPDRANAAGRSLKNAAQA